MDNQHRMVKGYRELTVEEIALINEIKAAGETLAELVGKVRGHVLNQGEAAMADSLERRAAGDIELARLEAADAVGWVYAARRDFQRGLMALTRAVTKPEGF